MKMNGIPVLVWALAIAIAPCAAAQQSERGWYLGAEAGQADFAGEHDTAFKLLGGYRVNRHLAAEGAYAWLFDKNGAEASAFEVTALGFVPLAERFSAFGRLGLANAYIEAPVLDSEKVQLTYGFGLQYDLTPALGIRGQWQRYDTDEELDLLSIGLVWRF
jgi:OOP family OmpA-OmpF porin